jgi:hypothetical protein
MYQGRRREAFQTCALAVRIAAAIGSVVCSLLTPRQPFRWEPKAAASLLVTRAREEILAEVTTFRAGSCSGYPLTAIPQCHQAQVGTILQ